VPKKKQKNEGSEDANFVHDASCMLIVKSDDLWTLSSYVPLDGLGPWYHKVHAMRALSVVTKSPDVLGADVREALDAFLVVKRAAEEPTSDALEGLAQGRVANFLRHSRHAAVTLNSQDRTLDICGGYGNGGGFLFIRGCSVELAQSASDRDLGRALLSVLEKVQRRMGK
jgi:hypothetical protein